MATTSPAAGGAGWKPKLLGGLALAIAIGLGLVALLNMYNYAIGTRSGVIDKLSTKGFACWTMEGQLALANFSQSGSLTQGGGTMDNTFYFSVPDKQVQKEIEAIPSGSPVTLDYRQKLFPLSLPIPFLCRRRTEYEIVGVRVAPAYAPNAQVPARRP
jgi:hypothetical protein